MFKMHVHLLLSMNILPRKMIISIMGRLRVIKDNSLSTETVLIFMPLRWPVKIKVHQEQLIPSLA
ncbi:hypothetical protein OROMI_026280 [Orobanche minor]